MRDRLRRSAWLIAGALLLACSSTDKPKPTPLDTIEPKIGGRQLWSARIGAVGFALSVAARNGQFVAASNDGSVVAFNADSGAELWRAQVGAELAAGVGSDGRFAAVVTRGNEVVGIDAGQVKWRRRVPARVVTAPLVAGERVFVVSVDRAVHAFDALDGRRLWTQQRPGDALTLSQAGVLAPFGELLLVGQGSRLAGLDPLRGSVMWEVPLASPRGSNEVERLADLVGPAVRSGNRLCARAFQLAVGCIDAARGVLLWSRNSPGVNAIGGDGERLAGADASDRITAWSAGTGEVAWSNEKLLYRSLSAPVLLGSSVVFGDAEGQVHFLSAASGELQLRLPTDGTPVIGAPAVQGSTLLVATRGGGLFAFRPH